MDLFAQNHLRGEERPKSGHHESLHRAKRPRAEEETRKKVSPLILFAVSHISMSDWVALQPSLQGALIGQGATETVPSWQDSAIAGSG